MRAMARGCLCLMLVWVTGMARAGDDARWANPTSQNGPAGSSPVRLGQPQPLYPPSTPGESQAWTGVTATPQPADEHFAWSPGNDQPIFRGQSPDPNMPPPPPPAPPPAGPPPFSSPLGKDEAYNCGVVTAPDTGTKKAGFFEKFWDNTKQTFGQAGESLGEAFRGRGIFQSDHRFDNFISPLSSPFLFEDPRALTEVRPIFMWQQTPTGNPFFHGGDNIFFGAQGRLAITDWFSIVVNKFGGTWMEPHTAPAHDGFSELWLGPKFTFLKNDHTNTLMAAGLTFQIPTGPAKVFQSTGNLSLAPYFSFAQNFGHGFMPAGWGSFNFMNTTGYSFRTDNTRSEYFYSLFHLDYDAAGMHKIYPLVELGWYHYTRNGHPQTFGFEGADLFNFGSNNAGHDDLYLAVGGRYKFNQHFSTGFGIQWGLLNQTHHLEGFRVTWDLIIRY
jgi:hypothetical protein